MEANAKPNGAPDWVPRGGPHWVPQGPPALEQLGSSAAGPRQPLGPPGGGTQWAPLGVSINFSIMFM